MSGLHLDWYQRHRSMRTGHETLMHDRVCLFALCGKKTRNHPSALCVSSATAKTPRYAVSTTSSPLESIKGVKTSPENLKVSCPSNAVKLLETASRSVRPCSTSPTTRPVVGLGLSTALSLQQSRVADYAQGDLRSVFLSIVNVLAIVPVASTNVVAVDCNSSRPCSAPTCVFISSEP